MSATVTSGILGDLFAEGAFVVDSNAVVHRSLRRIQRGFDR